MLILKKYRDYYDSAMGDGGIDKTCVYDRSPSWEKSQSKRKKLGSFFEGNKIGWSTLPFSLDYLKYNTRSYHHHKKNEPVKVYPFVIGFCGKLYVGYELTYEYTSKVNFSTVTQTKVVYDQEELLSLLSPKDRKDQAKKIFDYYQKFNQREHRELFIDYHIPVFVFDWGTSIPADLNVKDERGNIPYFITNPKLSGYEFFKIFNPFLTFQEIQMFLQGVLGSLEKELITVSEKDRVKQHGFDKWSFRNPDPPKRKQKNVN